MAEEFISWSEVYEKMKRYYTNFDPTVTQIGLSNGHTISWADRKDFLLLFHDAERRAKAESGQLLTRAVGAIS